MQFLCNVQYNIQDYKQLLKRRFNCLYNFREKERMRKRERERERERAREREREREKMNQIVSISITASQISSHRRTIDFIRYQQ